jgi:hypothetical protein
MSEEIKTKIAERVLKLMQMEYKDGEHLDEGLLISLLEDCGKRVRKAFKGNEIPQELKRVPDLILAHLLFLKDLGEFHEGINEETFNKEIENLKPDPKWRS